MAVHLPRDEAKEKISRLLCTGSQAHFFIQLHWEWGGGGGCGGRGPNDGFLLNALKTLFICRLS